MQQVLDRVIESSSSSTDKQINGYDQRYFLRSRYFLADAAEAITYTRQMKGYRSPQFTGAATGAETSAQHNTILESDAQLK